LYFPSFGAPVRIRVEDPTVASIDSSRDLSDNEKSGLKGPAPLKWFGVLKIVLKGESAGQTRLLVEQMDGSQWQKPTQVVVVRNLDSRQADGSDVAPSLRKEVSLLGLRAGALRIAEDQLYSAMANNVHGDGRYELPSAYTNWCGAYVYWCYKTACAIKGATNPFGGNNDVILSPQKAISWAIMHPADATVVRYRGPVMVTLGNAQQNAMRQDIFIDAVPGVNVVPGDVCLLRDTDNWKHVDMVYDAGDGDTFTTIDGNQGLPSIKKVQRSFTERLGSGVFQGQFKHVFVHLSIPA
jgi:hypothetical protein